MCGFIELNTILGFKIRSYVMILSTLDPNMVTWPMDEESTYPNFLGIKNIDCRIYN